MPNYIKPDQNTFLLRPSKAHFKGCEILVIVHSAIDSFSMRRGLRDTWIQFVTQKRVANVSVIFLIGNMATPVVEFSREGYKISKAFGYHRKAEGQRHKWLCKTHSWAKFKILLVRKPGRKFNYLMAKFQGSDFSF